MKIAHCTDLHINAGNDPVREVAVLKNAERVLTEIKSHQPDLIILGGDLAATCGEIEAYIWIKRQLDRLSLPFLILAGNHGSVVNLQSIFKQPSANVEELYDEFSTVEGLILCLDSSKASISRPQLEWFEEKCASLSSDTLLFLHHPPADCGCLFMDRKHPLQNRDLLFELIKNCGQISNIFCGHYHTERTIISYGKNIFITPSTMMEISPFQSQYEVSRTIPGWRLIDWESGSLRTSVHYVPQT